MIDTPTVVGVVASGSPVQKPSRRGWFARRRDSNALRPLSAIIEERVGASAVERLWELDGSAMASLSWSYTTAKRFLGRQDFAQCAALIVPTLTTAHSLAWDGPSTEARPTLLARWVDWRRTRALADREATAQQVLAQLAEEIADFVQLRAQRGARRYLATGLMKSCLLVLSVLGAVGAAVMVVDALSSLSMGEDGFWTLRDCLVCVGCGALGAVTSVLIRLRKEPLDYRDVFRGGALFRVSLGCLFALALLTLIKSEFIVAFSDPSSDPQASPIAGGFFWAAIGFIAGFNERLVGNLLEGSAEPEGRNPGAADDRPARDESTE